jgi:hypothetical protein
MLIQQDYNENATSMDDTAAVSILIPSSSSLRSSASLIWLFNQDENCYFKSRFAMELDSALGDVKGDITDRERSILYPVEDLEGLGALLTHLQDTVFQSVEDKILIASIKEFLLVPYLRMDMNSYRALQIFREDFHPNWINSKGSNKEGFSLFGLFDRTQSVLDKRKLREWMLKPYCDLNKILEGQKRIQFVLEEGNREMLSQLAFNLKNFSDVPRLLLRIKKVEETVSDWCRIYASLTNALSVVDKIDSHKQNLDEENNADDVAFIDRLFGNCNKYILRNLIRVMFSVIDCSRSAEKRKIFIQEGYDQVLDQKREICSKIDDYLFNAAQTILEDISVLQVKCKYSSILNIVNFLFFSLQKVSVQFISKEGYVICITRSHLPMLIQQDYNENATSMDDTAAVLILIPSSSSQRASAKSCYSLGYVSYDKAVIGITDRIFTRIVSEETVADSNSTFSLDLKQKSKILHHHTSKSLCLIDEFGKGTASVEGMYLDIRISVILSPLVGNDPDHQLDSMRLDGSAERSAGPSPVDDESGIRRHPTGDGFGPSVSSSVTGPEHFFSALASSPDSGMGWGCVTSNDPFKYPKPLSGSPLCASEEQLFSIGTRCTMESFAEELLLSPLDVQETSFSSLELSADSELNQSSQFGNYEEYSPAVGYREEMTYTKIENTLTNSDDEDDFERNAFEENQAEWEEGVLEEILEVKDRDMLHLAEITRHQNEQDLSLTKQLLGDGCTFNGLTNIGIGKLRRLLFLFLFLSVTLEQSSGFISPSKFPSYFSTTLKVKQKEITIPASKAPLVDVGESAIVSTTAKFRTIGEKKLWFADNTEYIEKLAALEETGILFFRPQRFGKSLFLNTLQAFYDIKTTKEQYDKWFAGLYIKDKGTALQARSYHVLDLSLDFPTRSPDKMDDEFNLRIRKQVEQYLHKYGMPKNKAIKLLKGADAARCLEKFVNFVANKNGRVLVLIDEYDRAMNNLMSKELPLYQKFVRGDSTLKDFFVRLKSLQMDQDVDLKYFVTGISPLFKDDISGWNSYVDLSSRGEFAEMLGFTERHLDDALKKLGIENTNEHKKCMEMFKKYCNGYYFYKGTQSLYNPYLCCNVLSKLSGDKEMMQRIIDDKMQPDDFSTAASLSNTIISIAARTQDAAVITYGLNDVNSTFIVDHLAPKLKFAELVDPPRSMDLKTSKTNYMNAITFLYYHGVLTLSQPYSSGPLTLKVPNRVVYDESDLHEFFAEMDGSDYSIVEFLQKPTAENLAGILNTIFMNSYTILDNYVPETALQFCIEKLVLGRAFPGFRAEQKVTFVSGANGFIDMIIDVGELCIVIELKRLRPNGLFGKANTRQDLINRRKDMLKYTDPNHHDDLLKLPLTSIAREYFKEEDDVTDVEGVVKVATTQLNDYCSSAQISAKVEQGKKLHKFVVIQIGFPFYVKKIA